MRRSPRGEEHFGWLRYRQRIRPPSHRSPGPPKPRFAQSPVVLPLLTTSSSPRQPASIGHERSCSSQPPKSQQLSHGPRSRSKPSAPFAGTLSFDSNARLSGSDCRLGRQDQVRRIPSARKSITRAGPRGLQQNLFFVPFSHRLEKLAQGRIGLHVRQHEVHIQRPAQLQLAFVIFRL